MVYNSGKNAKNTHVLTALLRSVKRPLRSLNETFDDPTKSIKWSLPKRIPRNASKRRNMETFRSHLGCFVNK